MTLLGQTVNSYHDGPHDFADLLRAVGAVDGIRRVRFTSPYPTDFTAARHRGDGRRRRRCASTSTCRCRAARTRCCAACCAGTPASATSRWSSELRRAIPGITLSTDVIVGFPGETDAQFAETLTLVTDADLDDAYTFKYSVREGTPAVRLRDHVPDEVASARLDRLIETVRANARRKNAARVGEMHEVLVERPARRGGLMLGRTRANHLVLLDLPASAVGEYHSCRLTGTTGSTFTGAIVTPALAVL